jgi:hypothetical protein
MRDRRRSAALAAALAVFVAACGAARPAGEAEAARAEAARAEAERALREARVAALLASGSVPRLDIEFDPVCTGYGPGLRGTGIDLGVLAAPAALPFGEEGAPLPLLVADRGCPRGGPSGPAPAPRG